MTNPMTPALFMASTDEFVEPIVYCGMIGAPIVKEVFTGLDYVHDVSLLVEMSEDFTPVAGS